MGNTWSKCPSLTIHANFLETLLPNQFFGVKNRTKVDPWSAQKHKTRYLDHGWVECQSALLECQLAHRGCRSALLECRLALWGANIHTQFFPDFSCFSNAFLAFLSFLKNTFSIWGYETLFQSGTNFLNIFKHSERLGELTLALNLQTNLYIQVIIKQQSHTRIIHG